MNKMFELTKVIPGVYLLAFQDRMELSAHFMRYQEYYESPDERIVGKPFQLMNYMKIYASKNKLKHFTYFNDWSGFNLPLSSLEKCYDSISDKNDYDHFMKQIAEFIRRDCGDSAAYLIGTRIGETTTINHEIAHGLYFVNEDYKLEMYELVEKLPKEIRTHLNKTLKQMGYNSNVFVDEIQAYLSTGLYKKMKVDLKYRRPFINTFKKYHKGK